MEAWNVWPEFVFLFISFLSEVTKRDSVEYTVVKNDWKNSILFLVGPALPLLY